MMCQAVDGYLNLIVCRQTMSEKKVLYWRRSEMQHIFFHMGIVVVSQL